MAVLNLLEYQNSQRKERGPVDIHTQLKKFTFPRASQARTIDPASDFVPDLRNDHLQAEFRKS